MVHLLNLKSKLKEGLRGFDLEMFRETYQKPSTSDSYRIGASSFHTYNTTIFKKNKKPYERLEKWPYVNSLILKAHCRDPKAHAMM